MTQSREGWGRKSRRASALPIFVRYHTEKQTSSPSALPPPQVMCSENNRLILLKTALRDEVGYARLNTLTMGDKGGESVVKICRTVRPQGLVRNAARKVFAIDDRLKPDHPSAGILRLTGGACYTHNPMSFVKMAYSTVFRQDGRVRQSLFMYGFEG